MKRKVKGSVTFYGDVQTEGGNFTERRVIGYLLNLSCGHVVRLNTLKAQPPAEADCQVCEKYRKR